MKRGKPLRRTPFKSSRTSGSLKRSPLNYRSAGMHDAYVKRRALVKQMLAQTPYCQACTAIYVFPRLIKGEPLGVVNTRPSIDLHELVNRSQGGDILNSDEIIVVCRECHRWITKNPIDAERLGLHVPGWMNTVEGIKEATRVRISWEKGISAVPFWVEDTEE